VPQTPFLRLGVLAGLWVLAMNEGCFSALFDMNILTISASTLKIFRNLFFVLLHRRPNQ